jgi:hypothetical protein
MIHVRKTIFGQILGFSVNIDLLGGERTRNLSTFEYGSWRAQRDLSIIGGTPFDPRTYTVQ